MRLSQPYLWPPNPPTKSSPTVRSSPPTKTSRSPKPSPFAASASSRSGRTTKSSKHSGPATKTRDLGGKTVIPGLIDNHFHFIRAVQRWHQQARIDGVASRAKALEIIAKKASSLEPGEWLWVQGGWSEGQFDKKGGFTLEELDKAAPDNPLFLQQTDRAIYANSRALIAAGLDPSAGANWETRLQASLR